MADQDHDQRMKVTLQQFLPEFVELLHPAWAKQFDFTQAHFLEQELYLDPPEGERRAVDLVARLPVMTPVRKCNETLLHIEIESADSLTDLKRRMPRYHHHLSYKHNLPVLSLALYLYVGLEGTGWDEVKEEYWDELVGQVRWRYLGLPALDALHHVEGANILGVAFSVLMRVVEDRRAWLKARALQRVGEAQLNAAQRYLLMFLIEAYMPLVGPHLDEYKRLMMTEEFKVARELGQTTFEKGEESGIVKGERRILRRQLELRFGPLSETARTRLDGLPEDKLVQLSEDLLSAKDLAELGLEDSKNGQAATPE